MKVAKSCEQCGKKKMLPPSHAARGDGRFCSRACVNESQKRPRPKPPRRPCNWCGKHIGDLHPNKKFCSVYCGKHRRNIVSRECPECGISFKRSSYKYPGAHREFTPYCSRKCAKPHLCVNCHINFAESDRWRVITVGYCHGCASKIFSSCRRCRKVIARKDAIDLRDIYPDPGSADRYPICPSCFESWGKPDHRVAKHKDHCAGEGCAVLRPWSYDLRLRGRLFLLDVPRCVCGWNHHSDLMSLWDSLEAVGVEANYWNSRSYDERTECKIHQLDLQDEVNIGWGSRSFFYDDKRLEELTHHCSICHQRVRTEDVVGGACPDCRPGASLCLECKRWFIEESVRSVFHDFDDESYLRGSFCSMLCACNFPKKNPGLVGQQRWGGRGVGCRMPDRELSWGVCSVCFSPRPRRRYKFCSEECRKVAPLLVEPVRNWNPAGIKEMCDEIC